MGWVPGVGEAVSAKAGTAGRDPWNLPISRQMKGEKKREIRPG
jgi:hypothetical protein